MYLKIEERCKRGMVRKVTTRELKKFVSTQSAMRLTLVALQTPMDVSTAF
jgi:hypothetical protein